MLSAQCHTVRSFFVQECLRAHAHPIMPLSVAVPMLMTSSCVCVVVSSAMV